MKRRLVKLVVFLLLGAIVNVAVAWGLSASVVLEGSTPKGPGCKRMRAGEWVRYFVWHRTGFERIRCDDFLDEIPTAESGPVIPDWSKVADRPFFNLQPRAINKQGAQGSAALRIETATGWPLRSLYYCKTTWRIMVKGNNLTTFEPIHSAIALRDHEVGPSYSGYRQRALPLIPLWPGFAINTVVYAVILCVVFAAPFALRRRRRIRRGLCPACAYPVGDSDVCTECGKPLIKQKAQTQKAEIT